MRRFLVGITALFGFLVLAGFVLASSNSQPAQPMVYVSKGVLYITDTMPVVYEGVTLSKTEVLEGKVFYTSPVTSGVHSLGGYTFEAFSLAPGETFTTTGISITANVADWGSAGVVLFHGSSEDFVSVTGWGYNSSFESGTQAWNSTTTSWEASTNWDYFMAFKAPVPTPVPPTPTNTPEPTPTLFPIVPPDTNTYLYMPVLFRDWPAKCPNSSNVPYDPMIYPDSNGIKLVTVGTQFPVVVNGEVLTGTDGVYYYPIASEHVTVTVGFSGCKGNAYTASYNKVATGKAYVGSDLKVTATTSAIAVAVANGVYSIWGYGYDTQIDWNTKVLQFWNNGWFVAPNYKEVTIVKVVNK